jgi:hypothetical protein
MATPSPINKPGTTILDFNKPRSTVVSSETGVAREIHPLTPVHLTASELSDSESVAKALNGIHESVRRATLSLRQDPKSAPCYVRNVKFANPTSNAAPITVTIPHTLNRPHTICHPTRSQGAAWNGFETSSNSTHVTLTTIVPAGVTAVHDFQLAGD